MGDKELRQKVNSNFKGTTNFGQGASSGYDCF